MVTVILITIIKKGPKIEMGYKYTWKKKKKQLLPVRPINSYGPKHDSYK